MFQRVGVEMPDQVFQEAWQEAERRDPRGEVYMPYTYYPVLFRTKCIYIHTEQTCRMDIIGN